MEQEFSYAKAIAEIEVILKRFNEQDFDVDSLAKELQRATELIAKCKDRLKSVEEQVAKIVESV